MSSSQDVLPGSHLCSDGAGDHGDDYTLAMSGKNGVWSMGSGALFNQQTFHKGMGFTQEGAQDRVVLMYVTLVPLFSKSLKREKKTVLAMVHKFIA